MLKFLAGKSLLHPELSKRVLSEYLLAAVNLFSWPFTAFDDYTGATCKFCQKLPQFVYYLSELSKHKKLA